MMMIIGGRGLVMEKQGYSPLHMSSNFQAIYIPKKN
jgi:hypothetical protein